MIFSLFTVLDNFHNIVQIPSNLGLIYIYFFSNQGLARKPRLAWNSPFSCLQLLRARTMGISFSEFQFPPCQTEGLPRGFACRWKERHTREIIKSFKGHSLLPVRAEASTPDLLPLVATDLRLGQITENPGLCSRKWAFIPQDRNRVVLTIAGGRAACPSLSLGNR